MYVCELLRIDDVSFFFMVGIMAWVRFSFSVVRKWDMIIKMGSFM